MLKFAFLCRFLIKFICLLCIRLVGYTNTVDSYTDSSPQQRERRRPSNLCRGRGAVYQSLGRGDWNFPYSVSTTSSSRTASRLYLYTLAALGPILHSTPTVCTYVTKHTVCLLTERLYRSLILILSELHRLFVVLLHLFRGYYFTGHFSFIQHICCIHLHTFWEANWAVLLLYQSK